jgi:hypothetical protein
MNLPKKQAIRRQIKPHSHVSELERSRLNGPVPQRDKIPPKVTAS